ncbi:MAG: glycosyltransferase family A protein [archaeon]
MVVSEKNFFSIIMPVYNKENYVEDAIISVLNQTFKNFELIIVCDPSTDNSNKIVEEYKKINKKIRIFYRDKPGPGGYAARNLGIKKSKANWIAFLDADDEWNKNHLEKIYKLIKLYPGIQVFTCARKKVYSEKKKNTIDSFSDSQNKKHKLFTFEDYLYYCIHGKRAIGTNSIVVNKNVLSYDNWFPDGKTKRSGDYYLWVILLANAGKFVWSSHIGSISYRSRSDVSKNNVPSVNINHEMVGRLESIINQQELKLLKKYANRLIRKAWFENKRIGNKKKPLAYEFYWENDIKYCLKWVILSLLPYKFYQIIYSIKYNLKND